MGYKIVKLDDPQGQCGLHPSHKWAVMDDVWGFKEAYRTKREAELHILGLEAKEAQAAKEAAAQRATRFKGTPGPWSAPHLSNPGPGCKCGYVFAESSMGGVAEVYVDNGSNDCPPRDEARANARLIAAAPDLLAALMELVDIVEGHVEDGDTLDSLTLQPARAALAKAGIE